MKKRKQKSATPAQKKNWFRGFIQAPLFIAGLICLVFEINIYEHTIINSAIPTSIWLLSGIIAIPLTNKLLKGQADMEKWYWKIFFSISTFGSLSVYFFMAINYYIYKDDELILAKLKVESTGHLAKGKSGCGSPYAIVLIEGVEKQLIFGCDLDIEQYKFVQLEMKNGVLGYTVIKAKIPLID